MTVISPTRMSIIGLSKTELKSQLEKLGENPFRAKQLWHWIYHQGVTNFEQMTTVSKKLQEKLNENFIIERPGITLEQTSDDT